MISSELNERLTRIGAGAPCGELLRRYWQPLCPAGEITEAAPKKRVRIMGEDLVVFRSGDGRYGCVEEKCKHRGASLYYGFVEPDGIRCCYHGWKYDFAGCCLEQPLEPRGSQFKNEIRLCAYPVQKLGGLLFAYLGPDPDAAPLLPRWDVLAREDGKRHIRVFPVHRCNWLQIQENTADSTHTYYLHGKIDEVMGLNHPHAPYYMRPIEKLDFSTCEWGINKVIVYGGTSPETEIRPPFIFPNILRIPVPPTETIHWRVPIDDENTRIIVVGFLPSEDGGEGSSPDDDASFEYIPDMLTADGDHDLKTFFSQDQMATETQGPIYDRARENLGVSDRGIVMFRKMLDEQIGLVERGEEPTVAVVHDPERNRMIDFPGTTVPVAGMAKTMASGEEA